MKVNLMQFIKTLQDYYISSIHLSVVDNVFPVSSFHIQEGNKCIKMASEPSIKSQFRTLSIRADKEL